MLYNNTKIPHFKGKDTPEGVSLASKKAYRVPEKDQYAMVPY